MPKPQQPPLPAYGSPEWKAMRAQMVGTPEWREANNFNAVKPTTSVPNSVGRHVVAALPFAPYGTTLTTEQKIGQNPLYNPLYDPGSPEYQQNLLNVSNPNRGSATPRIKMPKADSQKNPVDVSNLLQTVQDQNPIASSYTPPVSGPTASTPQITLPDIYQPQGNSGPSTVPPSGGSFGIKMPDFKNPLNQISSGSNWNDLLTVAHNRYSR